MTALVKAVAPIIPHTADEVWEYIPERRRKCSINRYTGPQEMPNCRRIRRKMGSFYELRDDVLKALEEARNEKVIGKSLEAKVTFMQMIKQEHYLTQFKKILSNYSLFLDLKLLVLMRMHRKMQLS